MLLRQNNDGGNENKGKERSVTFVIAGKNSAELIFRKGHLAKCCPLGTWLSADHGLRRAVGGNGIRAPLRACEP